MADIHNCPTVTGDCLKPESKTRALAAFAHRFTGTHRPRWANTPMLNGQPYPVQFADCQDWLRNTHFAVKKDGSLDDRVKECRSSPTWPNNPELRAPRVRMTNDGPSM